MKKSLSSYSDNSDITLMNTIYLRPKKRDNGKYDNGSMTIIYKDNKTNKKYYDYIENPDYEFYMAKPDVQINHNLLFIEKDKVDKISCPYIDLEKTLAELSNNENYYYSNLRNGAASENAKLHTINRFFLSDMNIEDHYRFRFSNKFINNAGPISKAYLDIEVDTINMKGDFPELGECPINAVTVIFEKENRVFTFLLRNDQNPLINEFESNLSSNTFDKLKSLIRDTVGGWKNEVRYGLDKLEYKMLFYDDELQMIQDLFILINKIEPDFLMAWNMAFDIPYIIERLKILGVNPEDIICHPDFVKNKVCRYYIDERHKNEIAERGDFATIASYTVYLDQMIHYKSRRKGQAETPSSLNYVGGAVAKVKKLDYSNITNNISKLPYLNYEIFVFYNIVDTIVQKCVEFKTNDIDYLFGKSVLNNTRYNKTHRQTIYLTNRGAKEFYNDGLIMGNNIVKFKEKDNTSYPGAYVASPLQLNDYSKVKINGTPSMLFDNLDDFDYKSLYPSIVREFNIAPNTQIGMIEIPEKIRDDENKYNFKYYTRGGALLEDLHSGNIMDTAHKWLNLADYSELLDDIDEFFTNQFIPIYPLNMDNKLCIFNNDDNIKKPIAIFDENNTTRYKLATFTKYNISYEKIWEANSNVNITK